MIIAESEKYIYHTQAPNSCLTRHLAECIAMYRDFIIKYWGWHASTEKKTP
jgi:hypothetical protein